MKLWSDVLKRISKDIMIERMIEVNDCMALDVLSDLAWVILLTNRVLFYWTRRLGLFILKYVYGYRNVYENKSIYVIISLLSKYQLSLIFTKTILLEEFIFL